MTTWHGTFVTAHEPAGDGDPAAYFRREFTIGEGLRRALLHVTALGIVVPRLNGSRVGDEVLAPGWTSYRHRVPVSTYDITAALRPGDNAIGAIVGTGWAAGRLGWEGKNHHYADRPALYLQVELHYDHGVEIIATDETFQVGTGAVLAAGLYDGETVDARLEPEGWDRPGFADESWAPAAGLAWDLGTLVARTAPPIRRIEELAPIEITTSPSGRTIVDFGQNISGWVRIRADGPAGETITLRHAELLTPAGELERETNRTAQATDRYTLRGAGPETWEPSFTFHGFRYVEIEGWQGNLDPNELRAVVTHSDMTRTGWFETSHPLVNRLHDNVVWSMRGNFVGVPTDCPQRDERLGWTGDLNAFAPTAAFVYDVRGVLQSWLADLAAEQKEKGYVPWVVPDILPYPSAPTALWSDVVVSLPWALYQEYGDLEILRDNYEPMAAFLRQVEGSLDATGLWGSGFQFGDWLDPDAPADRPAEGKTDAHLVAAAYLCKTTREAASIAQVLGREADAAEYDALNQRVRSAFHREYVAPSGRLVNESATAYALAIAFGILEGDQRVRAGNRLAEIVARDGYRIATGFAGTPLLPHALSSTGHIDEAYALLLREEMPSFLYPVTQGATTIWERWDSVLPDGSLNSTGMTSLNHYALGAVADWLHRVLAGLSAAEPGYRRVRIAPQPGGGITHAHAAKDTIHGRIEVHWRIDGDQLTLDVDLPEGVSADVLLPLDPAGRTESVDSGSHSWIYAIPRGGAAVAGLDIPIGVLAENEAVWQAVASVFEAHFPGFPLDGRAPEVAELPLRVLLQHIPGAPPELADQLRTTLKETLA